MSKCKDDAYVKVVVSKFYVYFYNEKAFIDYLIGNWFDADIICKCTHNMFIFFTFFPLSRIFYFDSTFSVAGMWAKCYKKFLHSNQETNSAIESYHCTLKTRFQCQKTIKCGRRMDLLLYMLSELVLSYYMNLVKLKTL